MIRRWLRRVLGITSPSEFYASIYTENFSPGCLAGIEQANADDFRDRSRAHFKGGAEWLLERRVERLLVEGARFLYAQ